MRKIILSGLFSLLLISDSPAQLRKAFDYFPLQVGNAWQYDNTNEAEYLFYEVVSDSLLGDSVRVYEVKRSGLKGLDLKPFEGAPYYYHYSADSTILYRDDFVFPKEPYTGLPVIDTSGGFGHRWRYIFGDCVCTFAVTDTGTAVIFNKRMNWLDVNTIKPYPDTLIIDETFFWRYALGIGPVMQGNDTLVYAKINGVTFGMTVGVADAPAAPATLPLKLDLQVYPNPFSHSTTISVTSPAQHPIEIRVIDLLGRTVRNLTLPGSSEKLRFTWDGRSTTGLLQPNGMYFITARSGSSVVVQKVLLLR